MPKVYRSSMVSYLPLRRQRLPRRVCCEDAEQAYRKEKLGAPNPVDVWLAARMARGVCTETQSDGSGSEYEEGDGEDEVRCTVLLQCIKAPEDDTIFSDPDTFVLHLTTTRVSASRNSGASSDSDSDSTDSKPKPEPVQRVVLGRYEGHPESLDAPQWTRLPSDEPVVFRDSAAAVADLLVRATLWKDAMTPLLEAMRAVGLDD
ncbi:hypothetical protein C8Q76DRAFT_485458 [Earliella scabrosa]|nr:hypothetical protein C8Q76DRAFT_485458 [Earliella scabrosa]